MLIIHLISVKNIFQENGTYLCLAKNKDGFSSSKFVLHVTSDKADFPFLKKEYFSNKIEVIFSH